MTKTKFSGSTGNSSSQKLFHRGAQALPRYKQHYRCQTKEEKRDVATSDFSRKSTKAKPYTTAPCHAPSGAKQLVSQG